jgi:hypothetical protein
MIDPVTVEIIYEYEVHFFLPSEVSMLPRCILKTLLLMTFWAAISSIALGGAVLLKNEAPSPTPINPISIWDARAATVNS